MHVNQTSFFAALTVLTSFMKVRDIDFVDEFKEKATKEFIVLEGRICKMVIDE